MTNYEELRELATLYAIDALEADERALIQSAIANDAALRTELDAHREVIAVLAEAVETTPPTPSPDLWDRISAGVAGLNLEEGQPELATVADIRHQRRRTRWATIISVAAVAVSLALGARVLDLQNQVGEPSLDDLASHAVTAEGSIVVMLEAAEDRPGATATVVLGTDGIGYVLSDTLPQLAADRTYQLWVIVDGGEPEPRVVSAGVLGRDPGLSQFSAAANVIGFAISEERAGGVPVSEGPTVAVGLLDA